MSPTLTDSDLPEWFANEDLAERYGVPLWTVRAWRRDGTGPRAHKFGRHVRYHRDDVLDWERSRVDNA